ncbi:MAG: CGNR zinc finger domain-containing protein [Longimicrobiales bacterium]
MDPGTFPFEADHLALDFLNAGLEPGPGPERVAAWLLDAGLATEADLRRLSASPPLTRILASESFALRAAVADAVTAFQRGALLPEHALFALNRVLGARSTSLRIDPRGVAAALAQVEEARFPEGLLAPVAAAAAELLAHGDRSRLRRCSAEGCGRWFYDVSRNGRRRWCSMARCGNRAKVAAHYRRHRQAHEDAP